MVRMIKSSLCFFISVLGCLANETPQELEVSRKILFDGQSLENWEITDFAGRGEVGLDGNGSAMLEFGIALTGIHWVGDELPRINDEIRWEAAASKNSQCVSCGFICCR